MFFVLGGPRRSTTGPYGDGSTGREIRHPCVVDVADLHRQGVAYDVVPWVLAVVATPIR